jgi:hypothetical protein
MEICSSCASFLTRGLGTSPRILLDLSLIEPMVHESQLAQNDLVQVFQT